MTTDPQTAVDFDGCNRKCRLAGAHTLVWGECEHAAQPEPTVSLSRVYTDADGFPAIGFDTYTVQQLGELITAGVRASDLPVNGDDLVDVGLVAAHAIFNRNEAASAAAVPVAAPPTTEQTALRDRIRRALCEAAGFGFAWGTDMLEPDEYGEVADAVLAVLPAPADRAATLAEGIAAIEAERDATDVNVAAYPRYDGRERMALDSAIRVLRRLAVEAGQAGGPSREATEPQPEAQTVELPFIHVDDDADRLEIGTVMASTYDGEAPVVYVAADQHHGDQVATVYVRPERVEQVITALRAARGKAAAPAVSSRPGTEQEA